MPPRSKEQPLLELELRRFDSPIGFSYSFRVGDRTSWSRGCSTDTLAQLRLLFRLPRQPTTIWLVAYHRRGQGRQRLKAPTSWSGCWSSRILKTSPPTYRRLKDGRSRRSGGVLIYGHWRFWDLVKQLAGKVVYVECWYED